MNGSLRTLHVEMGRQICGGPLQVLYLMRGLIERGHEASLICASGSGIEQAAVKLGIPVYPIRVFSDLDASIILKVYSTVRRMKPDVVHLHSRRGADLFGGLASRFARVPVVILSRRIDDPIKLDLLGRLKYINLPHKVIAISNGIKKALVDGGVDADKVEMVHSAIIPAEYRYIKRDRAWFKSEFGVPEDAPAIGCIGRLINLKGHRYLIEAIPDILKEYPNARFLLFGSGPLCHKLQKLARDIKVEDSLVFAGFRTDISRILPNLDFVVHPSLLEGLGVSLLQASAASLPIVATNVGGIPEVVRDEYTGLLVPVGDSKAISKAVLRLLNNQDLARRLGGNARNLVDEEFSVDAMVEGNIRVYENCLLNRSWVADPQGVSGKAK